MCSPYYSSIIILPEYNSTEELRTPNHQTSSSTSKPPTWYRNLTKKPPTTNFSKNPITALSRSLSQSLHRSLSNSIPNPNNTQSKSRKPKLHRIPTPYPEESKPALGSISRQHLRLPKNPLSRLRRSLTNSGLSKLGRGVGQRISRLGSRNRDGDFEDEVPVHCSKRCWCRDVSLHPEVRFAWQYLFCRAHDFETGIGCWSGGSSVYGDGDDGIETWGKESGSEKYNGNVIEVKMEVDIEVDEKVDRRVGVEDYKRCVVLEQYGRMASWRRDG